MEGARTGALRAGESLPALLMTNRAQQLGWPGLWHEAMGLLRDHRAAEAVLCVLELSRRDRLRRAHEASGEFWDPLPEGLGLAPLREWVALWREEALALLGEVLAPPPTTTHASEDVPMPEAPMSAALQSRLRRLGMGQPVGGHE